MHDSERTDIDVVEVLPFGLSPILREAVVSQTKPTESPFNEVQR